MKQRVPYLVLIIIGLIAFGNTLSNKYVLDDYAIILEHTHVQNGIDGISKILTTNYLNGVEEFNDGLYRPLSPMIFAFQNEISHNNPIIGHAFNVAYMLLISVILFQILMEVFGASRKIALGLSLLFLVLPIHTEVVANIKSSDELLALLFTLLSLLFFNKYLKNKKIRKLVLGAAFFFIALFSKENVFSFVLIIPAILYWMNQKEKKACLTILGTTIGLGSIFLFIRYSVLSAMPNKVDEGTLSALNNTILSTDIYVEKLGTALWLQVMYLVKIFVPYSLQHDYSFASIPIVSLFSIKGLIGAILVVGLAFSTWKFRKSSPLISVGIAWYFGSLIIVSNLLFPIGATFAERFVFTPSLGIIIVLLGVLNLLKMNENVPKIPMYLFLLVIGVYTFITINRNKDWKDSFTLYKADYSKLTYSARGNYNYGSACKDALEETRKPNEKKYLTIEAITALTQAIKIYPTYWDAYNNLGLVLKDDQQYQKAIQAFTSLVNSNKGYSKGWYNIGMTYFEMQDYQNALASLKYYNDLNPTNPNSWYFQGMCLGFQNNFSEAILAFNQSLSIDENHIHSTLMLGKAYGIKGDYQNSKRYFEKALQIDPNNQDASENLKMTNEIIKSENL